MSRNRITAGPKSVVCQETDLRGEISIGSILHPQCRVIAENGPIYIGRNNIIEENVIIFNNHSTPLIIDIEGSPIGNNNIVEARARVIGNTTVGNHCVIGAGCSTDANEKIVDYTVIYGGQSKRRTQSEVLPAQASLHARHLEYLREVLPKYNHLKKLDTM
ncbi:trimeric LpxA-like protein [Radiomyces spectabilis]|uniref:trimeric LpxA-like protein n=1 Tax=Radiomyces spectabilis TaxID=64574 RepID=UPI00221E4083|nr:trimeric LpxA-like protein [Radiomyces spectabilis]KAI8388059.1 trimeric LpxA-like protein [Radiomyces spectabilis]